MNKEYFYDLKIAEVLCYYDGDKIYTFYTKNNDLFIAYFADDFDNGEELIFIKTNEEDIKKLKNNEISIRTFFNFYNVYYFVRYIGKNIISLEEKTFEDIETYVPEEGVFLHVF